MRRFALICTILLTSAQGRAALVAEYRMDETAWTGAAGEIVDSVGARNGTAATGTTTTAAGLVCRGADLTRNSNQDYAVLDRAVLNGASTFSIAVWAKTSNATEQGLLSGARAGEANEINFNFEQGGKFRPFVKSDAAPPLNFSGTIANNVWHHLVMTRSGNSVCLYVDGVSQGCITRPTGALGIDAGGLILGQTQTSVGGGFQTFNDFEGTLDELLVFDHVLSSTEVNSIRTNNLAGLGWNGAARTCDLVGDWWFDEEQWSGAAGEVLDSSRYLLHGAALGEASTAPTSPARVGSQGTCSYGEFDGVDDSVLIPHNGVLNGTNSLTYTAWIRPRSWSGTRVVMGKNIFGNSSVAAQMGIFSESNLLKGRAETVAGRREVSVPLPTLDQWTHVALVFSGTTLSLYLNGSVAASTSFATTTLVQTTVPLTIGKREEVNQYLFSGLIDEVRVYRTALSSPVVSLVYNEVHTCPVINATLDHFVLDHDGAGINCLAEPVTVYAVDAGDALVGTYANVVRLDTQTGKGTWILASGSGAFDDGTANDGQALYTFALDDNGAASFLLDYSEGASPIDVDVQQVDDSTLRDDDSEGPLSFGPNGFTVTRTAITNPPPGTINDSVPAQTAGTAFNLALAAYGQTSTDATCGIIEMYTGNKSLAFWVDRVNPATGTLTPTVNGATIAASSSAAAAQTVAFASGQATVAVKYKDVGNIRINMRDSTSFAQPIVGASNNFVVRPADLVIVLVQTAAGVANPGASTATGAAFVPSGTAFRAEVEVRDSEASVTPNFGNESPAEGLMLTSASLVVPAGGRNGSSGVGTLVNGGTFTPVSAGRFRNTQVAFDEVGIIRMRAAVSDGDYLGSGAVNGTVSGHVGRFFPATYVLLSGSTVTPSCTGFTYMAQPTLGVSYTLEARNSLAARTENYAASLLGAGAVATVAMVAEDSNDGVDRGARLSSLASAWTLGRYALTTAAASFARAASADGPFNSLELGARLTDTLDSVPLAGLDMNAATTGNCTTSANCTAAKIGTAQRVVYGRMSVLPAFGPETRALPVPLEAQRYEGGTFVTESADTCTTYQASGTTLSDYAGNLAAGETTLTVPVAATNFIGGHSSTAAPLVLSAPGNGNDGSVVVTYNAPAWLEFDWNGTGATDPRATARFGRYRGNDRIIYWKEL